MPEPLKSISHRKQAAANISAEAVIDSLSPEGRGVAQVDGKTTFIDGALPGETVRLRYLRRRRRFDEAVVTEVLAPSGARVEPFCRHFGTCGGCRLQHMDSAAQVRHKELTLLEQFHHIGRIEPDKVLPPIYGPTEGYRHKARLGVKYVDKKQRVLVGFRERTSRYVAELDSCPVLHPAVGKRLHDLAELIQDLGIRRQLPQIEVAVDEQHVVLVLRHLEPLSEPDLEKLQQFAQQRGVHFYLQSGGPDSIVPLAGEHAAELCYELPDHGIQFTFTAIDFTQVNPVMNRKLVNRVVDWLQPDATDHILDLFCGLGNFTLPLARHAGHVTGVEGDAQLVARARQNATLNALDNASFVKADLMAADLYPGFKPEDCSKVVLDPPRSGAAEIISALEWHGIRQVAYVSCNPATLARDAGELVHRHGFRLVSAGVLDMFPHTAHVESLAFFSREPRG